METMLKLNKAQKVFLFSTWFESEELDDIFEMSLLELVKQEIKLDFAGDLEWTRVYVNGAQYTSINTESEFGREKLKTLLAL